METKFNFKSAICTSREQSEKLLALGLKKETADCYWFYCDIAKEWKCTILSSTQVFKDYPTTVIPAWSLGRFVKDLMPQSIGHLELAVGGDYVGYYEFRFEGIHWEYVEETPGMFDNIISTIEWLIKEGYFPKEYLV